MGRLRLVLYAFEFWEIILACTPILLSGAWFAFRNYWIAQNDFLATAKPTVDAAAVILTFGTVVIGYMTLKNELEKIQKEQEAQKPKIVKMQTMGKKPVNVRRCPSPSNSDCSVVVTLPPNTQVDVLPVAKSYIDNKSGKRSVWRKIRCNGTEGWVNDSLLWSVR